ncbi:hypothetical protein [Mycolicibacterium fortuitum]
MPNQRQVVGVSEGFKDGLDLFLAPCCLPAYGITDPLGIFGCGDNPSSVTGCYRLECTEVLGAIQSPAGTQRVQILCDVG